MMDSTIHKKRVKAVHLARRSSDDFSETYGCSALDSIAPFERDEVILGRRVGLGSFSAVYEIQYFNQRPYQSDAYTEEQVKQREATAKSVKNGARYVMKCLRKELEDDSDLFLGAAQDIVLEAEMLAALSHPNIVKLHGVIASRHDAFLGGASGFFIILERLESTLANEIEVWVKENNSFNPSRSIKSLRSSFSSSMALDKVKVEKATTSSVDKGGSLDNRLRVAASLAGAVEYLHSQGVIFRDLKPDNVGFDKQGNLKLFDFGLARFIPQHRDAYEDVFEMSGAGSRRYTAPEVFLFEPYNLKADVYSFSVVLWELMWLKKPFAKYKQRKEFEEALLSRVDKALVINRRWPLPIREVIRRSISRDLVDRPTMSEVCTTLNECASSGGEDCDTESTSTSSSTQKHLVPPKVSSKRFFHKFSLLLGSATSITVDSVQDFLEEVEQTVQV